MSRRQRPVLESPAWYLPWLRVQLRIRLALATRFDGTWCDTPAALKTMLVERRRIRGAGWFN